MGFEIVSGQVGWSGAIDRNFTIVDNEFKSDKKKIEMLENNLRKNNILINSDFQLWQRGTSFSGKAEYTADRWKLGNPYGSVRKVDTGARFELFSLTSYADFIQPIEDYSVLVGEYATFSIEATVDLGVTANLYITQNGTQIGAPLSIVGTGVRTRYTLTSTIPIPTDIVTPLAVLIRLLVKSDDTSVIGDGMIVHNTKLEEGKEATKYFSKSLRVEERDCYRFYYKFTSNVFANSRNTGSNNNVNFTPIVLPVPMRINGVVTFSEFVVNNHYIGSYLGKYSDGTAILSSSGVLNKNQIIGSIGSSTYDYTDKHLLFTFTDLTVNAEM